MFHLDAVDDEMRRAAAYEREGHTARTLLRLDDLRVVLVVMKAGSRIKEHQADGSACIHALCGHLRVRLPDRTVDVPAGRLLALAGGLRHDVEAVADSAFLLTLPAPSRRRPRRR